MPVATGEQTAVFAACILSGIITGILYDIISAVRHTFGVGKAVVFMLDLFFWTISVIIFFAALQCAGGGEIHWYEPTGAILGFALYMTGISKFFLPPVTRIVGFIKKIIFKLTALFMKPVIRIFKRIFKVTDKFVQNARKKRENFVKNTLEKLRRFVILLKKY